MLNHTSPTIFIIDDHKSQRHILENCLNAIGYCNVYGYSSPEALITQSETRADIVILENKFNDSKISGIDFMWLYKSRNPATNFFFYSSDRSGDLAKKTIQHGAVDYYTKGLSGLEQLVYGIDKFVISKRKKIERLSNNLLIV